MKKKRIDWVAELDEQVRQGDYDTAWELEDLREVCERAQRTLDVIDRRVNAMQGLVWAFAFAMRVLGCVLVAAGVWWIAYSLAALIS